MRNIDKSGRDDETINAMEKAESPCIRNCSLDEQRICRGCFRHLDEIMSWPDADDRRRRDILERAAARRGLFDAMNPDAGSLPA
ncbi:MAG TPA: DUF1289 domain-containing protein [Gammaproteobacteria bacterium]